MWWLRAALPFLFLLGACEPDIVGNTYFCGPERNCPPHLECQVGDQNSFGFSCVNPLSVDEFACSTNTGDEEPDNTQEEAHAIGTLDCGAQIALSNWGCISDGQDVDHFTVVRDAICAGNTSRFHSSVRYPIGLVPMSLELLNEAGEVVAVGELCTAPQSNAGLDERCIDVEELPLGTYTLRVGINEAANADCDGTCRYNRYQLFISSPLS